MDWRMVLIAMMFPVLPLVGPECNLLRLDGHLLEYQAEIRPRRSRNGERARKEALTCAN